MSALKLLTIVTMVLSLTSPVLAKRLIDCKRCGLEHLLRSPAIGIDINSDSLCESSKPLYHTCVLMVGCRTAAIKSADGSLAQLARITASDELRILMKEWAKETIPVFPE